VSLTDPQAAWVARKGVEPFFAYDANYLIDNKVGISLDAEGTRANRTDEIAVTETMIERVEHRFGLAPERLAGDTAYGAARLLKWLRDKGIAPHVPVWDKSKQTGGRFTKEDLVFDRDRNVYICPDGRRAHTFRDRRSGAHSSLQGEHDRLLDLRAQTPMHNGGRPEGLARHRRGRARSGSCARQYRSLPGLAP
jgi:Transposase DDE domain